MKELNLFKELLDEIGEPLQLVLNKKADLNDIEKKLNTYYSKDEIWKMSYTLTMANHGGGIVFHSADNPKAQPIKYSKEELSQSSNTKQHFVTLWSYVLSEPDNLRKIYDALPKWQRLMAYNILTNYYLPEPRLTDTIDYYTLLTDEKVSMNEVPVLLTSYHKSYYYGVRNKLNFECYPDFIFDIVIKALSPEILKQKESTNQLPTNMSGLATISFEKEIPDVLLLLKQQFKNVFKLHDPELRLIKAQTLANRINLREYDNKVLAILKDRHFRTDSWTVFSSEDGTCFVEDLSFDSKDKTRITLKDSLKIHINSLNLAWTSFLMFNITNNLRFTLQSTAVRIINHTMTLLEQSEDGKWYSVDYLRAYLVAHQAMKDYVLAGSSLQELRENQFLNRLSNLHGANEDIAQQISLPLASGFLFFLNCLGIVDIVVDTNAENTYSYYDSLRYFRPTKFGLFTLGRYSEYHADHEIVVPKYFEFSSEYLIFKSLVDNNPILPQLEPYAKNIGGNRYQVSFETFKTIPYNAKDVDNCRYLFEEAFGEKLPNVWQNFFKEMKNRIHPLEEIASYDYEIYKLDPENKDLLNLLTTDPTLRNIIIRAENFMILVPRNHKSTFKNRLKKFGYFL